MFWWVNTVRIHEIRGRRGNSKFVVVSRYVVEGKVGRQTHRKPLRVNAFTTIMSFMRLERVPGTYRGREVVT